MEAQAIFLNPFTVCPSFVYDKETEVIRLQTD